MEWLQWGFPIATALSLNTPTSINGNYTEGNQEWIPAYARMTKARCEGQPRASEAKGPLPAEEGWVMEKREKEKKKK